MKKGEKIQKLFKLVLVAAVMLSLPIYYCHGAEDATIKMSTTSSTQASGLLDILIPAFFTDTGIRVKVIAKGTGAAIRDGMDGNVDLIFVHARTREEKFVSQGFGTRRYPVMHNDFVILGPKADPAGVMGTESVVDALKKIAHSKSLFVSRGDDSGTHTKEQLLWKETDLPLITMVTMDKQTLAPADSANWYLSVGQGMGKTLTFAHEKQTYTLSDRGTYIKYRFGREIPIDLHIVCEGDPSLANPYGVIPVNPKKFPHVRYEAARQFARWITSPRGQQLIAEYRLLGKQLFYPDATED